ncbi:MAG: hypothetical protein ACPGSH_04040, partial [Ilumatobacteraceae bacterium]
CFRKTSSEVFATTTLCVSANWCDSSCCTIVSCAVDSEAARAFAEIARAVAEDLRPKKVFSPELRVI